MSKTKTSSRLLSSVMILSAVTLGTSTAQAQRAPTAAARLPRPPVSAPPAPSTSPAPSAPAATATETVSTDPEYLLGASDVVEVSLVGRTDFSTRSRIDNNGAILLPFVGSMPATGKTALQLSDDIRKALIKGGYFSDPIVRVDVVGVSSRYVTVLGAVGSPGLVPLDRRYRLSEVIARVGGKAASGADFVVLTRAEGGTQTRYSLSKLAAGTPEEDPYVATGDKIYVPSGETEVLYVSGQVNSPGSFPIQPGMTFRMAIARAGGVNDMGSEKKLKVMRSGERLKARLDDPVQVGDVITVGERLF